MRRHRRSLGVIGFALALFVVACADIDANAPGLEVAATTSDPDDVASAEPTARAGTTATAPSDETETNSASGSIEARAAASCDADSGVEATVVNVEEWVRLRADASLSGEELALLPVGSTVTVWPDTLLFDGADFWWVAASNPADDTCGYVAGLFLESTDGRLDGRLQGVSIAIPQGWTRDGNSEHGGPRWVLDESPTQISVSVLNDTIDDWVARFQVALDEFFASPAGDGFARPTQAFTETEVPGADRSVRLVGFPSDDGISATVLAQVGNTLVVADSYNFLDGSADERTATIENFLSSLELVDPNLLSS